MNADRIVVVEHGELIEQGSHHELIAKKGRYADLWSKQVFLRPRDKTEDVVEIVDDRPDLTDDVSSEQTAADPYRCGTTDSDSEMFCTDNEHPADNAEPTIHTKEVRRSTGSYVDALTVQRAPSLTRLPQSSLLGAWLHQRNEPRMTALQAMSAVPLPPMRLSPNLLSITNGRTRSRAASLQADRMTHLLLQSMRSGLKRSQTGGLHCLERRQTRRQMPRAKRFREHIAPTRRVKQPMTVRSGPPVQLLVSTDGNRCISRCLESFGDAWEAGARVCPRQCLKAPTVFKTDTVQE